jgi:hypothetical protein
VADCTAGPGQDRGAGRSTGRMVATPVPVLAGPGRCDGPDLVGCRRRPAQAGPSGNRTLGRPGRARRAPARGARDHHRDLRADHRLGPLWRFDALHHSQEELSVLTSFRPTRSCTRRDSCWRPSRSRPAARAWGAPAWRAGRSRWSRTPRRARRAAARRAAHRAIPGRRLIRPDPGARALRAGPAALTTRRGRHPFRAAYQGSVP